MGVTSGIETPYPSGAPEFTLRFYWGSWYSVFSFICMFCRMFWSGYFWWLRCFLVVFCIISFGIGYGSMNIFRGLELYRILYTTDHRFTNIRQPKRRVPKGAIICWSLHCDVGKLVTVYMYIYVMELNSV